MGNVVKMPGTQDFILGDLTLQLRFDGNAVDAIEQALGEGFESIMTKGQGEFKMLTVRETLIILQGANKMSGVPYKKLKEEYNKEVDKSFSNSTKLKMKLFEVLQEAGFMVDPEEEENEEVSNSTNGELGVTEEKTVILGE